MHREYSPPKKNQAATQTPGGAIVRGAFRMVSLFVALGLICLPALAGRGNQGRGSGPARMSPDLVKDLNTSSPADTVRLIIRVRSDEIEDIEEEVEDIKEEVEELGGSFKANLRHVGSVIVDLPLSAVEEFVDESDVEYVAPDRPVHSLSSSLQTTTGASLIYSPPAGSEATGVDGAGIGVAVVDSGIQYNHRDLRSNSARVILRVDFTNNPGQSDPYGHGTHVAGLIAGNGAASLLSGLDFAGIAPNTNLIDLRVLDENGQGSVSTVIAAIDFAIAQRDNFNIRVINLSLAAQPVDSYVDDPLCQAVTRASQAGIVVVVAAGNYGMDENGNEVYGGITSPGITPEAITVGAVQTYGTDERSDDEIAPFSSRGPTMSGAVDPETGEFVSDNLPKPDLVAPGVALVSLEVKNNTLVSVYPQLHVESDIDSSHFAYMALSGTSTSAGVVSGTVALMLQANPSLTPNRVKAILMYTAQIMEGPDLFQQGSGLLNVEGAVRVAVALAGESEDDEDDEANFDLSSSPFSTIAGEQVAWAEGLIWGNTRVHGRATMRRNHGAWAQGLIWGTRRATRRSVWGAGVMMDVNLYADGQVLFGNNGAWSYGTWDEGTTLESGLLVRLPMSMSGLQWDVDRILEEFFSSADAAGLVWGFRGARGDGLLWGVRSIRAEGLIWGVRGYGRGRGHGNGSSNGHGSR